MKSSIEAIFEHAAGIGDDLQEVRLAIIRMGRVLGAGDPKVMTQIERIETAAQHAEGARLALVSAVEDLSDELGFDDDEAQP